MWEVTLRCVKKLEKQHCTGLIDEDPSSIQPLYIEKTEIANDFFRIWD
jgi:hypothetical protein